MIDDPYKILGVSPDASDEEIKKAVNILRGYIKDYFVNNNYRFIDTVKRFLIDQELIVEIGNDEVTLTEKAKTIVERYFMELEYNKNIFSFIYGFEEENLSADN